MHLEYCVVHSRSAILLLIAAVVDVVVIIVIYDSETHFYDIFVNISQNLV